MEFLKALFNGGSMTYEQLAEAVKTAKMNVVNLSEGGYVSQNKFDDRINALNQQVNTLTEQLSQRDTDMAALQTSLDAAKADAGKLAEVQKSLTDLQTKYKNDKADHEKALSRQAYEFAVREKANSLKFSSAAAKKAFLQEAIGKDFKLDGDTLLGYEDFLAKYRTDDPGAFVTEEAPASNPLKITLPGKDTPVGQRKPLSELMRMKNANPDMTIDF